MHRNVCARVCLLACVRACVLACVCVCVFVCVCRSLRIKLLIQASEATARVLRRLLFYPRLLRKMLLPGLLGPSCECQRHNPILHQPMRM